MVSEAENTLFYGDNLDVVREEIPAESVDLIYLDPPFNSSRTYNVLFSRENEDARAQIRTFDDTWTYTPETDRRYQELQAGEVPNDVADALQAFRRLLGKVDVVAYLISMAPRLVAFHDVLKPTGNLFLHCDPTASHYLKVLLDMIFGTPRFENEIIWRRTGAHSTPRRFETIHDVIFFYSKSDDHYFNQITQPYTKDHVESRYKKDEKGRYKFTTGGNIMTGPGATEGESGEPWRGFDPTEKDRHWAVPGYLREQMPEGWDDGLTITEQLEALYQEDLIEIKDGAAWPHPVKYLQEDEGTYLSDIWAYQPGTEGVLHGTDEGIDADVKWMGPTAPERLGYETQKPVGLLKRIIKSACPPDGVVMDPFCGCGTTIAAGEELNRTWMGIDITYLAVDLIETRLEARFGPGIKEEYQVRGIPEDLPAARDLADRDKFDFERWAVSLIPGGEPNEKQVGDEGVDGVSRFPLDPDGKKSGQVAISVKGGENLDPSMVRGLLGSVEGQEADMGILVTLKSPTKGMIDTANKSGVYEWPVTERTFPKIQIMTVEELLEGERPQMPPTYMPYIKAQPVPDMSEQEEMELNDDRA